MSEKRTRLYQVVRCQHSSFCAEQLPGTRQRGRCSLPLRTRMHRSIRQDKQPTMPAEEMGIMKTTMTINYTFSEIHVDT